MHTPQCTYTPSCLTSIRISESFTSLAITRNASLQSLQDSSMHDMYKGNFNQVVCCLGSKSMQRDSIVFNDAYKSYV